MALQWLEQQQQQAVSSVTKLAGLTACSHLVELANGERYVLRSQTQQATDYGIDYQQEVAFLRLIEPLGFTPKIIYANETSALLAWINGQTPSHFSQPLLAKLADQLASLHRFDWQAVRSTQNLTRLNLAERCQFLWQNLPLKTQNSLNFTPPFKQISPYKQTICHHDIHLANLVEQDEKLFLIDWEYAAISDPALELALLFHYNPLSAEQKAFFLARYFAKSGFDPTACVAKMVEYQPEIEKLNRLWFRLSHFLDTIFQT